MMWQRCAGSVRMPDGTLKRCWFEGETPVSDVADMRLCEAHVACEGFGEVHIPEVHELGAIMGPLLEWRRALRGLA